jgi:hypothetical protein
VASLFARNSGSPSFGLSFPRVDDVGPRYWTRPVVRNRGQPLSARHTGTVSQRSQADFFATQSSPTVLCPNADRMIGRSVSGTGFASPHRPTSPLAPIVLKRARERRQAPNLLQAPAPNDNEATVGSSPAICTLTWMQVARRTRNPPLNWVPLWLSSVQGSNLVPRLHDGTGLGSTAPTCSGRRTGRHPTSERRPSRPVPSDDDEDLLSPRYPPIAGQEQALGVILVPAGAQEGNRAGEYRIRPPCSSKVTGNAALAGAKTPMSGLEEGSGLAMVRGPCRGRSSSDEMQLAVSRTAHVVASSALTSRILRNDRAGSRARSSFAGGAVLTPAEAIQVIVAGLRSGSAVLAQAQKEDPQGGQTAGEDDPRQC